MADKLVDSGKWGGVVVVDLRGEVRVTPRPGPCDEFPPSRRDDGRGRAFEKAVRLDAGEREGVSSSLDAGGGSERDRVIERWNKQCTEG